MCRPVPCLGFIRCKMLSYQPSPILINLFCSFIGAHTFGSHHTYTEAKRPSKVQGGSKNDVTLDTLVNLLKLCGQVRLSNDLGGLDQLS